MKTKLLFFSLLLLAMGGSLFAQSTTVSGQVTDAGAQSWNNGTFTAQFVPNPQFPQIASYTWTGGTLNQTLSGVLNGTGGYSGLSVPSNSAITPQGSHWQFSFCPQASSPCFTTALITITGGSQTVNATPPAIAIQLSNPPGPFTQAYADAEIVSSPLGGQYYNVTLSQLRICTAISGNSCTTWGGSSSGASNAAPKMAFYLTPDCSTVTNAYCFNTPADTQQFNDGSWSNVSNVITFNSTHFGPGQAIVNPVGMSVMGFQTCATDLTSGHASGGEIAPNAAMPTVTGFTGTTLTISATPANNQSLVTTFPIGGCVILGHIDDSAFATLWTALNAAPICPKLYLAAAYYLVTTPPQALWGNPTACQNIGPALGGPVGNPGFGALYLSAGYEVDGRGRGNTVIGLSTNFPNGDSCQHKPTPAAGLNPQHVGGCMGPAVMGMWRDFRITGFGQGAATALNSKTLIYTTVSKISDFTCDNYGGYTGGNSTGIEASFQVMLTDVNVSGCGALNLSIDSGASDVVAVRSAFESASVAPIFIAGPAPAGNFSLICYWCVASFADSQPFGSFAALYNQGGSVRLIGSRLIPGGNGNDGASGINGNASYTCASTPGCILRAEQTIFHGNVGGGSNTNGGISCSVACTNYLSMSDLRSQSSGSDYTDVVGSKLFDLGGNVYTPRFTLSGSIFNEVNSANATIVTAAKLVLSAGWGSTAANTALSGGNAPIQFTITNSGTGQGASPTITYTFPTPYPVAPFSCTATQIGGTNATGTFTSSSLSATGVTFTFSLTPTAASTEIVQVTCVTP